MYDFEIYELIKSFYDRRVNQAEFRKKEHFDISKVKDHDLENSNVSKREFE